VAGRAGSATADGGDERIKLPEIMAAGVSKDARKGDAVAFAARHHVGDGGHEVNRPAGWNCDLFSIAIQRQALPPLPTNVKGFLLRPPSIGSALAP